jgi:hypothetical protein
MIIIFLSSQRFPTVSGYVTFLAALETGNLAYGSRSESHNRFYSGFLFVSRVTLVTRVTRFSAVTIPIPGHPFDPVSLVLGRYSVLFHKGSLGYLAEILIITTSHYRLNPIGYWPLNEANVTYTVGQIQYALSRPFTAI